MPQNPKKKQRAAPSTLTKKGYDPERIYQKIRSAFQQENLTFDPKYQKDFYVDNIVIRTLARILAEGPSSPILLTCDENGSLNVSTKYQKLEHNQTIADTAADDWSAEIDFEAIVYRLDIWVWDNPMIFKRGPEGGIEEDEIELDADSFYSFDAETEFIFVKNKTVGLDARYQIVGWY